jgi:hypothetical protein
MELLQPAGEDCDQQVVSCCMMTMCWCGEVLHAVWRWFELFLLS